MFHYTFFLISRFHSLPFHICLSRSPNPQFGEGSRPETSPVPCLQRCSLLLQHFVSTSGIGKVEWLTPQNIDFSIYSENMLSLEPWFTLRSSTLQPSSWLATNSTSALSSELRSPTFWIVNLSEGIVKMQVITSGNQGSSIRQRVTLTLVPLIAVILTVTTIFRNELLDALGWLKRPVDSKSDSCPSGYFRLEGMKDCMPWLSCEMIQSEVAVIEPIGQGAVKQVGSLYFLDA